MKLQEFIKIIAINLVESDAYSIISDKEYKLGIIYESENELVVPYYEVHYDSFILRITKYNKLNFEEISSKSFETEEDAGIHLTKIKVKESELNKELAMFFDRMSMFVKQKDYKVIN